MVKREFYELLVTLTYRYLDIKWTTVHVDTRFFISHSCIITEYQYNCVDPSAAQFKRLNRTHLHPSWLDPGLVAELDQSDEHGQPQPTNQNIKHSRHVAQTECARLVLSAQRGGVRENQSWCRLSQHYYNYTWTVHPLKWSRVKRHQSLQS